MTRRGDKVMAGINFHLKPHPVAVVSAATAGPILMRGFQLWRVIMNIALSRAVRLWRLTATGFGSCRKNELASDAASGGASHRQA